MKGFILTLLAILLAYGSEDYGLKEPPMGQKPEGLYHERFFHGTAFQYVGYQQYFFKGAGEIILPISSHTAMQKQWEPSPDNPDNKVLSRELGTAVLFRQPLLIQTGIIK